jgi:hypothetical protein
MSDAVFSCPCEAIFTAHQSVVSFWLYLTQRPTQGDCSIWLDRSVQLQLHHDDVCVVRLDDTHGGRAEQEIFVSVASSRWLRFVVAVVSPSHVRLSVDDASFDVRLRFVRLPVSVVSVRVVSSVSAFFALSSSVAPPSFPPDTRELPLRESGPIRLTRALSFESSVSLPPKTPLRHGLLVCHDFKGNYVDADRRHDTVYGEQPRANGYFFDNWSLVSCFVYFSHYFCTIPPRSWASAARRNGVPILGTLITEHVTGEFANRKILESPQKSALSLAAMCAQYAFDGWLINIESPLPPHLIPRMAEFLSALQKHVIVVMYDSLCYDNGAIEW